LRRCWRRGGNRRARQGRSNTAPPLTGGTACRSTFWIVLREIPNSRAISRWHRPRLAPLAAHDRKAPLGTCLRCPMNPPNQATAHETQLRRWSTLTPPPHSAPAARCGLFLLRRSCRTIKKSGDPSGRNLAAQKFCRARAKPRRAFPQIVGMYVHAKIFVAPTCPD
jgi:hypothetical protein